MRSFGDKGIRLVIQEIRDSGVPSYRLIAYPRRSCMRADPAIFTSLDELLARLTEVLPGVDARVMATGDSGSQILFAREVELSDEQLKMLGLAD